MFLQSISYCQYKLKCCYNKPCVLKTSKGGILYKKSYFCTSHLKLAHCISDFYMAWKVISKELLDYSVEPAVARR